MVFEFFFQASAGILVGIAVVVLPCMYIYQRFFNKMRNGRGRQ